MQPPCFGLVQRQKHTKTNFHFVFAFAHVPHPTRLYHDSIIMFCIYIYTIVAFTFTYIYIFRMQMMIGQQNQLTMTPLDIRYQNHTWYFPAMDSTRSEVLKNSSIRLVLILGMNLALVLKHPVTVGANLTLTHSHPIVIFHVPVSKLGFLIFWRRAIFLGIFFCFPAWFCGFCEFCSFCGFCGCVASVASPCFTNLPIYLSNLT